jgi:hypothetical protein
LRAFLCGFAPLRETDFSFSRPSRTPSRHFSPSGCARLIFLLQLDLILRRRPLLSAPQVFLKDFSTPFPMLSTIDGNKSVEEWEDVQKEFVAGSRF